MKKQNLLVVAHPDDETIFFGGLLQMVKTRPWRVICVTDGNADGLGAKRRKEFLKACRLLGVAEAEVWDFPDRFDERLNLQELENKLRELSPGEVYTHGILGEYGHPHHQDVCLAVHRAFNKTKVWSVAYNCQPERLIKLSDRAFVNRREILSKIYFNETKRFQRWLPLQSVEGFVRVGIKEIEAVHSFMVSGAAPSRKSLKVYSWFFPYLSIFRSQVLQRVF